MDLVLLVLLGGVVALDGTSVGQVMISRPLVAATLAGTILGVPALGLLVGAILELFYIVVVPAGGALFPEGGPASVVAAAAAATLPGPGGVALAVLLGLAWGQIGGVTIVLLRQVNGRLALTPGGPPRTSRGVTRLHGTAVLLDLCRGFALTAGGLLLSLALGSALGGGVIRDTWPFGWSDTLGVILFGAAAPLGMLLRNFVRTSRGLVLFALGVAGGALLAVLA